MQSKLLQKNVHSNLRNLGIQIVNEDLIQNLTLEDN